MTNSTFKILAKTTLPVMTGLGVHQLFHFINKRKILILLYHGITPNPLNPADSTQLDANEFTRQMEYLKSRYHVLPLLEVIRKIKMQEPLPDSTAVITFDDGFENNYSVAFPILKRLGIPATIFLSTGLMDTNTILWPQELYLLITASKKKELDMRDEGLGQYDLNARVSNTNIMTINTQVIDNVRCDLKRFPDVERSRLLKIIKQRLAVESLDEERLKLFSFLSWKQIKEMQGSGLITFGSHTVTHPLLSGLSKQAMEQEISGSFEALRQKLGINEIPFAYTFGEMEDYTENTKEILRKYDAVCALTTSDGLNHVSDNLLEFKRVFTNITFDAFKLASSGFVSTVKSWKKRSSR